MNRVCMLVRELFLLKKDLSFLGISWRTIIYRKYDKFHVKIQPERIYVRELSEGTFRVLHFALLSIDLFLFFFFFFIQYLPMDIEPFSYFFFFFYFMMDNIYDVYDFSSSKATKYQRLFSLMSCCISFVWEKLSN